MKKTSRIEAVQGTLRYLRDGYYTINDKRIEISAIHKMSVDESVIISPEEGNVLADKFKNSSDEKNANISKNKKIV